jgi:hypothetical protein
LNDGNDESEPDAGSSDPEGTPVEFLDIGEEVYFPGDFVYISNPENPHVPTVAQIHHVWSSSERKRGITVCWFIRPEQTKFKATVKFYKNEVFKTNRFENYTESELAGRCYVLHVAEYKLRKPQDAPDNDLYVCESMYNMETGEIARIKKWHESMPTSSNEKKPTMVQYHKPLTLRRESLNISLKQPVALPSPSKRKREISEETERILPKRRATLNVNYDSPTPLVKTIAVAASSKSKSSEKQQFHLPGPLEQENLTKDQGTID